MGTSDGDKFSVMACSTSRALSQWRTHIILPGVGVKSEIDCALDSLASVHWWCIDLWIDQEGNRGSIVPWLSHSECLFILHQLMSPSFQLTARVETSLSGRMIPQHHRHGRSHRQNTGRQLSKIGLRPASMFSMHLQSQSLFESLLLSNPTSWRMARRCVNRGVHFRFLCRTACLLGGCTQP